MPATTSLARQLEQLKTASQWSSGSRPKAIDATVASLLGPSILKDSQLGLEQITLLAKDAFQKLSTTTCQWLKSFKVLIFDRDLDDMDVDGDDEDKQMDELLILLSPYILQKEAQYLLQFLLCKHKVYLSQTEVLFFACLPYYEYSIFHRLVACLPLRKGNNSQQEDYPRWVEHFRHACHPATSVGLHRHLASDRGFYKLINNLMHKLAKVYSVKYPRQSFDGLIHFYATAMVSALNLCSHIDEVLVYDLLRVIMACLKSKLTELFSCGLIMFAYLVPRVALSAKAVAKLMKIIEKLSQDKNFSQETLALLAILFRCQESCIDKDKVFSLLMDHEPIILEVFSDQSNDNYLQRLQKLLSMVLQHVLSQDSHPHTATILRIVHKILSMPRLPSSEIAQVLIACTSEALTRWKNTTPDCDESVFLASQVLAVLREHFIEEYAAKCVYTQNDIFVMEGIEETPSSQQVALKRIRMNNALLKRFLLPPVDVATDWPPEQGLKKALKDNSNDFVLLLGHPDLSFLSTLFADSEARNLVENTIRWYQCKPKVFSRALDLVMRDPRLSPEGLEFDFLLMSSLFVLNGKNVQPLLAFLKQYCHQAPSVTDVSSVKTFLSLIIGGVPDSCEDCNSFNASLMESFVEKLSLHSLSSMLDDHFRCRQVQADVSVVLLLIGVQVLQHHMAKDQVLGATIMQKLVQLSWTILPDLIALPSESPQKGSDQDLVELLNVARKRKKVPTAVFVFVLDKLKALIKKLVSCSPDEARKVGKNMVILGCKLSSDSDHQALSQRAFQCLDVLKSLKQEVLVDLVSTPTSDDVDPSLKIYCATEIGDCLTRSKPFVADLVNLGSTTLMRIACAVLTEETRKVQKILFKFLNKVCSSRTAADSKKSGSFRPLIQFLVDSRAEVMSSQCTENLDHLMKGFVDLHPDNQALINHMLSLCIKMNDPDLFCRLCPALRWAGGSTAHSEVALYGCKLLDDSMAGKKNGEKALMAVITVFMPTVASLMLQNDQCAAFLEKCIRSADVSVTKESGKDVSVSSLCLDTMRSSLSKMPCMQDSAFAERLFSMLVDVGGSHELNSVSPLVRRVLLKFQAFWTPGIYLKLLNAVWGSVEMAGTGLNKLLSRSVPWDAAKEEQRWHRSRFLLEICCEQVNLAPNTNGSLWRDLLAPLCGLLKRALDHLDQLADAAYLLDLMASLILSIIEKMPVEELSTLSAKIINPELFVTCIRTCGNPNTKATALMILAKSSVANPEYVLHNSIPIFTFMGTHFLKVDSQHSFDVACQAIDVIVPHIQKVGTQNPSETNLNILHTFVDASHDIPAHRCKIFLHKLISRIGVQQYFWILSLLLLRKSSKIPRSVKVKGGEEEKHQQIRELFAMFSVDLQLEACLQMIIQTRSKSKELLSNLGMQTADGQEQKHFDALRIKSLSFIHSVLTSKSLQSSVASAFSQKDLKDSLKDLLLKLLEASVRNLEQQQHDEEVPSRSYKASRMLSEKVMEATLSLLPPGVFFQLTTVMLRSGQNLVRKKALDVLLVNLQQNAAILRQEAADTWMPLLDQLALLGSAQSEDNPFNQQMALLCLSTFARVWQPQVQPKDLVRVVDKLVPKLYVKNVHNGAVVAASVHCITELFQAIGPMAVAHLSPFVTWLLAIMQDASPVLADNMALLNSITLSIKKCMDCFSGFLHPFYQRLIVTTCKLAGCLKSPDDESRPSRHDQVVGARLKVMQTALAQGITSKKMVDLLDVCFDELKACPSPLSLISLSSILRENVASLEKNQALAVATQFFKSFQNMLRFRAEHGHLDEQHIDLVETHFIETFLTLALKLPLDDFKPIFYRLFNVSYGSDLQISPLITVFHVTTVVAQKLKALFSFICETLVQKSTYVLVQLAEENFARIRGSDMHNMATLYGHIFGALTALFSYNRVDSLLVKNYEDHVNALLANFEAPLPDPDKDLLFTQLSECVAQLAVSTEDETQWKYLNYQVIMFIRNEDIKIRLQVLTVLEMFLDKKGENYLTVLPDAVPLLAEALDDGDSRVEAKCRKLIKKMETVFGHSVESYFE